jgi:hypothetical protein
MVIPSGLSRIWRKWRATPCRPIKIIHEKAPTNEGIITGSIPKERIRFLAGNFTRATIYPMGTPSKIEKMTTEKLKTKEFRRLFWYNGEVRNLLKFDTPRFDNESFAPEPIKALKNVVIKGQNRKITKNPKGMANTR